MIPNAWLEEARQRITPYIKRTPLYFDERLNIYLKWENQQVTGSFKARGAFNRVLSLVDWERQRGLVAASAGNHGQGVAMAGQASNAPVTVFVSEHAVPTKVDAMRLLGAQVIMVPGGYSDAEKAGLEFAKAKQKTWISPYNDGLVIAGQGTIGLEVQEEIPLIDHATWLVPISGGGLIAGIAIAIKEVSSHARKQLVGVQTTASPFFHALYYKGSQDNEIELPSLADGLAGPVEANSITIPIVRRYVDEIILVDEDEIRRAIAYAYVHYHERIEGSGAVTLAAVLSGKIKSKPAVVIISGGNIQPEVHKEIVEELGTNA